MPTILVSGAASGLGAAFVEAYQQGRGNTILAIDRQEINHQGEGVHGYAVDISSQESVDSFVAKLADTPIDIIIHSAGIRGLVPRVEQETPGNVEACETIDAMDKDTVLRTFEVNAAGTFILLRALLPNLRMVANAKVIILSSRMGSIGYNQKPNRASGGGYAYRAFKAAVNAIVRSFAVDVPEVTFVLCHPGRVETKLVQWKEEGAIPAHESTKGILPLIAKWGKADSGKFFDRFGNTVECLTCRQRKLKCSEERPICAQCAKANRECVPSSGITFRHQQNPSMNGEDGDHDSLKSFYGYKETFGKSTKWVEIPKDLTFIHTSNPYDDEEGENVDEATLQDHNDFIGSQQEPDFSRVQVSYSDYATHGLEALSAVASQDQYNYGPPPAPMSQRERTTSLSTASPQHRHVTPSQNLDFILNPTSALSPVESNIDPRLHSQTPAGPSPSQHSPSHVRTTSFASLGGRTDLRSKGLRRRAGIEDPELAFLLRDYAERPGLWMDEFDLGLFFAAKVPVLAVTCPLLLYACAALSAKSLARCAGRKPVMGGMIRSSCQSKMEFWPNPMLDQEGWFHKGRQYYDIAVSLLRQSLAGASRPPTSSLPEDATPTTLYNVQNAPLPTTDSDELVAATAILCVYEFLDASGPEWSRHLDGAKTLFDIAKDRMMVPLTLPPSPVSIAQQVTQQLTGQTRTDHFPPVTSLTAGRKAVFWNFARQDMLSAFINNTSTRLDTGDLPMWRNAGLKLTPNGFVSASNPLSPDFTADQIMGDDMVSNALVWLTMKLINFIAAGDDLPANLSPLGLGVCERELLEYWESLDEQLCAWYDGLPDGFYPTAVRVAHPEYDSEKWFPRPMCASTMQWYHFCRIQLLHNKPHISAGTPVHGMLGPQASGTSLASRHASYAAILAQSRDHAKEIVAMALGRHDEGTRIHSVQPLWTAGLVLGNDHRPGENGEVSPDTEGWRRTIVGLLRGIERDMGWAAEYRVQSLLDLWGGYPMNLATSPIDLKFP